MTGPTEPLIPRRYPKTLTAGTSLKVDRQFPDYANTDFGYELLLAGAGVARFTTTPQITPDADGVTYHIFLQPADTSPLSTLAAQQPYRFEERLYDASTGEKYAVGWGVIMVEPDLATVAAGAMVSYEEQTLQAIEAKLQGRLTSDQEHYSIAGRSISRIPIQELIKLRGQFRAIVWKQRNPGKLTTPVEFVFPPTQGVFPDADVWRWRP